MRDDQLLLAFKINRAERLRCLLHRQRHVAWLRPADGVTQWSVGRYMAGRALLRNQPSRPGHDVHCHDLLRAHSDTSLMLACASTLQIPLSGLGEVEPFRYGRWLFATQGPISLVERRSDVFNALPPAIRRARKGRRDAELLFLHLVAELARNHLLERPATAMELVPILQRLTRFVDTPINILTTDGRVLWAYRTGPPLFYCTLGGMQQCERCRISDTERRFAALVESHRRTEAVCVSSRPLETPDSWHEIPEEAALVVDLSINTELVFPTAAWTRAASPASEQAAAADRAR